jgi:hypothetical protein
VAVSFPFYAAYHYMQDVKNYGQRSAKHQKATYQKGHIRTHKTANLQLLLG